MVKVKMKRPVTPSASYRKACEKRMDLVEQDLERVFMRLRAMETLLTTKPAPANAAPPAPANAAPPAPSDAARQLSANRLRDGYRMGVNDLSMALQSAIAKFKQ